MATRHQQARSIGTVSDPELKKALYLISKPFKLSSCGGAQITDTLFQVCLNDYAFGELRPTHNAPFSSMMQLFWNKV